MIEVTNTRLLQGTTESSKKQKLFLMSWCPDSAKIKKKMLYASSFETLKKSLVSVKFNFYDSQIVDNVKNTNS